MTNALVPSKVRNVKMGDMKLVDSMLRRSDGCMQYSYRCHCNNIAKKYNISREDQDAFARISAKAIAASTADVSDGRSVEVPGERCDQHLRYR
ncbi:MAG: hypothetical protein ACLVJ6_16635 [Merdibacter sp.]